MRGLQLHPNVAGAEFIEEIATAPRYRVHSIGGVHPGMYQVDDGEEGASISGELYQVPIEVLLKVIEGEPAGLYRGPVLLADGPGRLDGRRRHGSWRSATSRPTRSRAHRSNRPAGQGRASTTAPRPTRTSMRIPVRSVDR